MADRSYVIHFEGDRARIRLALPQDGPPPMCAVARNHPTTDLLEYHIPAPSAQRAELIARAMRKEKP